MALSLVSRLRLTVHAPTVTAVRGRKFWPLPADYSGIELPPEEERKLTTLNVIPDWHGVFPRKYERALYDMRGPETINNQLIHKQFGLIALTGWQIAPNHIKLIETVVNKWLDTRKMFAVWRIEPPWKPVVKKGQGKRMGGGKAPIHHYVTPVRAGHIIVEIGGHLQFEECYYFLDSIAKRMPFDAMAISQQMLTEWENEEKKAVERNVNPFSFERVVRGNMQGCKRWLSPYEERWFDYYV